jgi:anaerobic selenocysteine-containing dehydrogenase
MSVHSVETKTVRGACPQDCPDTCAFLYHVEDGKLVDVTGDPNHPMTRGGLCVKLKNFAEHHYNPDRVLYPLKRVGPKGSGQFERRSGRRSSPVMAAKPSCRTVISETRGP